MFKKVLFLRKSKDKFADLVEKKLKAKTKNLKVISTDINNVKIKNSETFDYVFAMRSHYILKRLLLKKIKYAAINFHPGPPSYRGIGCVNYALYNNCKYYGSTAHLIDEKIDHGKIIDVKLFKISQKDSIEDVLNKTYKIQFHQVIKIINYLLKEKSNLKKLIFKNKKYKWSKKIKNRDYLNSFYNISKNINKKNLTKRLRATVTTKFKPYVELHGFKFYLR